MYVVQHKTQYSLRQDTKYGCYDFTPCGEFGRGFGGSDVVRST